MRQWLPKRGGLGDAWVGTLLRGEDLRPRHEWYDVPRIVGTQVVLRLHAERDVPRVLEACNDKRTAHWLSELPQPYTLEHAQQFVAMRSEAMASGTGLHWMIADPSTDAALGVVSLMRITRGREAEVGYWAHPDARGRGLMTEAVRLAVRHAFVPVEDGGLGLSRLSAYAGADNTASRHVIEVNGFVQTGVQRQTEHLRDDVVDLAGYDLLREEFTHGCLD